MRNPTNDSNYELLHRIGKGSHGTVHKAINRETGEICAIKKLSISNSFKCVSNEIKILSDCKCKNIVRFLDSACSDTEVSIVMEYCYGGSVRDVINYLGPLTEDQILVIVKDILSGLDYLHSKQKIHRDVKAANILLTRDGVAKLGDFGVSEPVDTQGEDSHKEKIAGTILWLPPEVLIKGQNHKPVIDIWSLGITIIEMAETQPPNKNREVDDVFKILRDPNEPPPSFAEPSKWSDGLTDLLRLCLVKNPNHRRDARLLLQHETIKDAPPNSMIEELVVKVCANNITRPGLARTIYDQTESLVKESQVLVNICKERRNKVKQFNQMDNTLRSHTQEFKNQQNILTDINFKIDEARKKYDELLKDKCNLEREKNDLETDLKKKKERQKSIARQLEIFIDKRQRYQLDELQKREKLMSLGAKSG